MTADEVGRAGVGPVLQAGPFARALVAAITEENPVAVVQDEGAYLRVMSPGLCVLTRARVEDEFGAPVQFPGDLEVVMPSFAGRMRLTEDEAVWWIGDVVPPQLPDART
jgi:toluene monooxygenase system protein D